MKRLMMAVALAGALAGGCVRTYPRDETNAAGRPSWETRSADEQPERRGDARRNPEVPRTSQFEPGGRLER